MKTGSMRRCLLVAGNESFRLIGQPDVELRRMAPEKPAKGSQKKKGGAGRSCDILYQVEVRGFDDCNTKTGGIESLKVMEVEA